MEWIAILYANGHASTVRNGTDGSFLPGTSSTDHDSRPGPAVDTKHAGSALWTASWAFARTGGHDSRSSYWLDCTPEGTDGHASKWHATPSPSEDGASIEFASWIHDWDASTCGRQRFGTTSSGTVDAPAGGSSTTLGWSRADVSPTSDSTRSRIWWYGSPSARGSISWTTGR